MDDEVEDASEERVCEDEKPKSGVVTEDAENGKASLEIAVIRWPGIGVGMMRHGAG